MLGWAEHSEPDRRHGGDSVLRSSSGAGSGAGGLEQCGSGGVRQPLPLRGQPGQVGLEMQQFASGVYQYGLVVDGRLVAQRQMVVAR